MPDKAQSPDIKTQIAIFVEVYVPVLRHHADFLDAVEQNALSRTEKGAPRKSLPEPGMYARQASQLRSLTNLLETAHKGSAIPLDSPEARMALQEQFTKVIGTLAMIIGQNAELNEKLVHGSSPKNLEDRYRKKHYIPDGDALEEGVQKHIRRKSRFNRSEAGAMTEEIILLSDAKEALNDIRSLLFKKGPQIGTKDSGVSLY